MDELQLKQLINNIITERLKNDFGIYAFSDNIDFKKKKLKLNNEKIGLWDTTPAVQPTAIADAGATPTISGANTVNASNIATTFDDHKTKINAILAALRLPGFIDT